MFDRRNIAQANRHAIEVCHQQVAHLVQVAELVDGSNQVALAAFLDASTRDVDVFLAQPVNHQVHGDIELRQAVGVDQHLHLVLEAAANLHGSDAIYRLEPLLELVVGVAAKAHELSPLAARGVLGRGQHQAHHRFGGRIEAQHHGRLGFQWQAQDVEFVAHLQACLVHVGAPGKLQHHVALAGAGDRLELAQSLDHAYRFFHRLADQRFDFNRRGAGVFGAHRQCRVTQVGQQVDLQVAQRDETEQHEGEGHHRHGHAAAGGELDEIHLPAVSRTTPRTAAVPAVLITWTSVPSRMATLPAVTTISPSFTPDRISASSPLL